MRLGIGVLAGIVACSPSYAVESVTDAGASSDATVIPACSILFVSPSGDDARDGCDGSRPKRTIAAAIAAAAADGTPREVHVCHGTFNEAPLNFTRTFQLRGGYDCTTWTRSATFGDPGMVDANESLVTMGKGATAITTVDIRVPASQDFVFEGFTVQGPSGPDTRNAVALQVTDGGGVVRGSRLIGGRASNDVGYASVGVELTRATTLLERNRIEGGDGTITATTSTVAVAGLWILGGSPVVRGNSIWGGTGSSRGGAANVAIEIDGDDASHTVKLQDNDVTSGNATMIGAGSGNLLLGLSANGPGTYVIDRNVFRKPLVVPQSINQLSTTGLMVVLGISVQLATGTTITNNRVDVGTLGSAGPQAFFTGISVNSTPNAAIVQNVVVGGGAGGGYAALYATRGISVQARNATILANTFLLPPLPMMMPALLPTAIYLGTDANASAVSDAVNTKVKGNLILGEDAAWYSTVEYGCTAARPVGGTYVGNFTVGLAREFGVYPPAPPGACVPATPPSAWTTVNLTSGNSNNTTVSVCGLNCLQTLIDGWDSSYGSFDRARAVALDGVLRFRTTTPCSQAKLVIPDAQMPAVDLSGTARTALFSPGAWEQDTCL